MATNKRRRKNRQYYDTILVRLIDVAAVNTRAIFKYLGVIYPMKDLKRALANGLAAMAIRPELMQPSSSDVVLVGDLEVRVNGPSCRLDNTFHTYSTRGSSCRRCAVHRSKRCSSNRYCVNCQVTLCNDVAWLRYHTLQNYTL